MGLNDILKKGAIFIERKQHSLFNYDVKKQKKYVESFEEPMNDIQRSYYQYRCQMKLNPWYINWGMNVASFFVSLGLLLKISPAQQSERKECDALFFHDGKPENIIPNKLRDIYNEILPVDDIGKKLDSDGKKCIIEIIKKYPFSWHFILKNIIKIARYAASLELYKTKAIIVCAEYSFTSSVLTWYCERKGIKHIDVMHGEKLYYMRDSFFRFHECYVWDSFYKELLISLRAQSEQFVVEIPASLVLSQENVVKKFDYTYYLAAETLDEMKKIGLILKQLSECNYSVKVRPHPRSSRMDEVNECFAGIPIEDVSQCTIEHSLMTTHNAISVYSTVLNQAYHSQIGVVIDDVTNVQKVEKLRELHYIMFEKKHKLLSKLLTERELHDECNA